MKKALLVFISLITQGYCHAEGFLRADLVATDFKYRVVAPDDVNPNRKVLMITLAVKNIGNLAVVPGSSQHATVIGPQTVGASVYGPASRGGRLGDKLFPGETGLMLAYLPLGTIRHCMSVRTHIDLGHQLQKGGSAVFANDQRSFTAIEPGNIRPCVNAPLPHP